jgi:hypothetical protein
MEMSGQLHDKAALPPGKEPLVPTGGMKTVTRRIISASDRSLIQVVQHVARHFIDWIISTYHIPGPCLKTYGDSILPYSFQFIAYNRPNIRPYIM